MRYAEIGSSLSIYLREINKLPLLTAEQERELANRIAEGDPEAREILIRSNLRLVVSIATKHARRGVSLDDLINDGNMGLIRAAESFDPHFKTRFSTYASFWVKQSIKRAIVNTGRIVRLPAYIIELMAEWNKAKNQLINSGEPEPTDEQIAKKIDVSNRQLKLIKKAQKLHQVTSDAENGSTLIDAIAVDGHGSLYDNDKTKTMLKYVDKLPPREGDVIRMRFGLGCDELTLNEIGDLFGITRERIRQIEAEALARLNVWLSNDLL